MSFPFAPCAWLPAPNPEVPTLAAWDAPLEAEGVYLTRTSRGVSLRGPGGEPLLEVTVHPLDGAEDARALVEALVRGGGSPTVHFLDSTLAPPTRRRRRRRRRRPTAP